MWRSIRKSTRRSVITRGLTVTTERSRKEKADGKKLERRCGDPQTVEKEDRLKKLIKMHGFLCSHLFSSILS